MLNIYIFTSRDDSSFTKASEFAIKYSAKLVDKLSSDYDDLYLIATNKIVYTPTMLMFEDNKEIVRMRDIPDNSFMEVLLNR